MAQISLKTITDDILLLVRNNNISESEDFSRAQIHAWIKTYKNQLWKEERDRKKLLAKQYGFDDEDTADNEFIKRVEIGPLELEDVPSKSTEPIFMKRTVEEIPDVLNNAEGSILAVHDQSGEVLQYMNHIRRHYAYWRRYTFGEMTAFYKDDKHLYVQGTADMNELKFVYVLYLLEVEDNMDDGEDDDKDEDEVMIPAWLVPGIKERILKNELSFMLNRPSDDSNNATLASVKPHGPQDDEE